MVVRISSRPRGTLILDDPLIADRPTSKPDLLAEVLWNTVVLIIVWGPMLLLIVSFVWLRLSAPIHTPLHRAALFAAAWFTISVCCHCSLWALQKRSAQKGRS